LLDLGLITVDKFLVVLMLLRLAIGFLFGSEQL